MRAPRLTLALLLTIAVGIGCDVSVYGFARGLTSARLRPEMAEGMSRIGMLLGCAAGAVFFIACINVISFLLGRAFARLHETSLRVALGASRRHLARELLSDSLVISVAGGAFGALLAMWAEHIVPAFLFEEDAAHLIFAPDLFSIFAASTACIAITIGCGLIPAFVTSGNRPGNALRRESGGPSKTMARVRSGLVVAQMASCCILVISTAFLIEAFHAALQTSAGRRLGDPILASVQAQPQPQIDIGYFQQVERAVHTIGSVSKMAWVANMPGSRPAWQSFRIEPRDLPLRDVTMYSAPFTARSLKLFALPPISGRLFGFGDQLCRAAVVNEEAAAELFGQNTVGRTIQNSTGPPVQIIGVLAEKGSEKNYPTIYFNQTDDSSNVAERISLAHFRIPIRSQLLHVELDANIVSPNYFDVMGLPFIAGRDFTEHQIPGDCRVGIVNQEAADLYFHGKPVGAAIIDDRGIRTTVIAVVRSRPLGVFQRRADPAIYFPMWQACPPRMTLIVGIRNMTGPRLADLRRRIESVPGRGPAPLVIETLAAHLAHTALAPLRIATVIIGASATMALMLGSIGLFGALSDAVERRRRELAIRAALGAQRRHVIYQVLREGGQLACAGTLLGMLGSLALLRLLSRIAPNGSSPTFWVWLAAPVILTVAVVIASVLPARRALIVNPLTIMRED